MTDSHLTWKGLRERIAAVLRDAGVEGAERESRWIVEHCSGLEDRDWSRARHQPATSQPARRALDLAQRRAAGEPLQYVLGSWPFRELDLLVDPRVLIPRPETEQVVVDVALDEALRLGARHRSQLGVRAEPGDPVLVVDLGTGSGAIALSLAHELAGVRVLATDVSRDALEVARLNAVGNAVRGVTFLAGEWFDALDPALRGRLSMVVSNPPYVSEAEWKCLDGGVADHEPHQALVPGPTGREALEHIVAEAGTWLRAGGALVLELAPDQSEVLAARAAAKGFGGVRVVDDLAGRPRVLVAHRSADARS